MALVRIQKFLSECGIASRRKSEALVVEGKIRVNGKTITELGTKVDPDRDDIYVNNKPVRRAPKGVLLFHKPRGVVSTMSDPEGRPTVADYMTKQYKSYFPVGRLDFETSGLMVLTNDGEMAEHLMHPGYGYERVYHVRVEGRPSERTLEKIETGVRLEDGPATAKVRIIRGDENATWLEIRVQEGRNRLVRRMMDHLRHSVLKLRRVALGPFRLGNLETGEVRKVPEREYEFFRKKIIGTQKKPREQTKKSGALPRSRKAQRESDDYSDEWES